MLVYYNKNRIIDEIKYAKNTRLLTLVDSFGYEIRFDFELNSGAKFYTLYVINLSLNSLWQILHLVWNLERPTHESKW